MAIPNTETISSLKEQKSRKFKFKETNVLKLNSLKARNKLNWVSKWNLSESLKQTLKWNESLKKGVHAREICEKQFLNYINKK